VQQHCTTCTSHYSQTSLRLQKDGQNLIFIQVRKNLASQESQVEKFYCMNIALTHVSTWPHLVLKHNIFAHYTVDLGVESF